MFGEVEFGADGYCGRQWRDQEGEHMCFEPLAHPRGAHICECGRRT